MYQPDANQEPLVSDCKSVTTKLPLIYTIYIKIFETVQKLNNKIASKEAPEYDH